ncbi:uncharacterized protein LY79DRAFT_263438 [Colletotrichum navitas]|uniref:Uncharacterized protein n=1 Tax=Colletotrichum navitas TaxID=681940 RepID=A0AAD8V4G1_9PEZI|nr:uncharacterized protein LY79DRAFT_263438 [Colletotrichum navitas]KAK1585684.1 hypothetical protein LY79DRAFT_263438 [Colletotrichum navitas]
MQVQRDKHLEPQSIDLVVAQSVNPALPTKHKPAWPCQSIGGGGAFHHCHRYLAATISTPAGLLHPSILPTYYSRIALSARSQAPGRLEILLPTVHTHHPRSDFDTLLSQSSFLRYIPSHRAPHDRQANQSLTGPRQQRHLSIHLCASYLALG